MDIMEEHIVYFEHSTIKTKKMTNQFFKQCFISDLKKEIKEHVEMNKPTT